LGLADYSTHSEVTYLDASLIIKENIVKLDISVQHTPTVAMSNTVYNLLKDSSCLWLIQALTLLYVLKKIPTSCVFHDHKKVARRLKYLKESDYVCMTNLLKDLNFLQHFLLLIVVLH
jgi:hypothetical protein